MNRADIDPGFAGRRTDRAVHAAIAALEPGDPLRSEPHAESCCLLDAQGRTVGRLAKAFRIPDGMIVESIRVVAVVVRRREETPPEHLGALKHERREAVLPEIVFAPSR